MTFPLHRLLELRDPSALVGVCGPVEPAILSYYLELIGIGAGDRVVDGGPAEPAPAVVSLDDLRAARVPLAAEDAEPAATVRVRIRPDRAVQVLSAHDRLPDGGTRISSGAAYIDELYRYGARTGARLAADGAVGVFAVDFALDETGSATAIGPSNRPGSTRTRRCWRCARTRSGPGSRTAWTRTGGRPSPRCARPGSPGARSRARASSSTAWRRSRR